MSHQPGGHQPGGHQPEGHLPGLSGSAPPPFSSDFAYAVCDCVTMRGEIGGKATLDSIVGVGVELGSVTTQVADITGPVERDLKMGQIVSKGACLNPVIETQISLAGTALNVVSL
jgi:hypothetical protein